MLWINGYTTRTAQLLGISPKEGMSYWGRNLELSGYMLKDWNWLFIHPNSSLIGSARSRFEAGYNFAILNERQLLDHVILSGNSLQMVAHQHGVAFAEGIAAYLYEEKSIAVEYAVYLQGTQMGTMPQTRRAINCRIVFKSESNFFLYNANDDLRFADVVIKESLLDDHFCKYDFTVQAQNGECIKNYLYLRNESGVYKSNNIHLHRPFQVSTAVAHARKLYEDTRMEVYGHTEKDLKLASLQQYWQNQN